jgi:hypothetical protein
MSSALTTLGEDKMTNLETRKFNMLTRVRDFGSAHASSFPTNSLGGELFIHVTEIVETLEGFASEKSSTKGESKQSTTSKVIARATLKEMLEAIRRTARAIAVTTPGFDEKFRFPKSFNDQNLSSSARAFAADALPLKAEFIRHEMSANFIVELNAAIEQFDRATSESNLSSEARFSATQSLSATIGKAMKIVLQLDAVVRNKFKNDPIITAAWAQAAKVERAAHRTKAPKPPSPVQQISSPQSGKTGV